MKLLLVGANSSLALALKPRLEAFAEVVTAGRSGCDVPLDLAGPAEALAIGPGFDVVVNTAASFGGKTPALMRACEEVNVLGLLKLCQACTQAGVGRLVQVSSIFAKLTPDSPFYSAYAMSKKHGDEAAALHAASFGLPLLTIRPAQLYGVGPAYRRNQPFLYTLMDKAQQGQDIVIYGKHDALRNFIHVDDVATVIARAVQQQLVGCYDCVHPENVGYARIAQAAIAAFGSTGRVSFAPEQADIPDNAFPADDALYQAVGYRPRISIEAGLRMEADHRRATA